MERQKLLSSTQKFRQALEGQVDDLKDGAIKLGIQGLVFGGIALGSFLLVRAFRRKPKASSKETAVTTSGGFMSSIFASIQAYIASFLLSLAREKITTYLENRFLTPNVDSATNPEKARR